eukprot:TRINITY_DN107855_c0_g1_i1.p1 TRINITY_DN107855_c0_g1~~TRINITY_DN107855_c0_g1_i1.p1  ORF type:complete len:253 (-),score=15.68 TRINITY_DN107855_c0_g1_i1:286-1044(-)
MVFGLDDVNVPFGVHDFRQIQRSELDYQKLLTQKADTRNRIFGVGFHEGTFNAHSRARSYGTSGFHPKGEYHYFRHTVGCMGRETQRHSDEHLHFPSPGRRQNPSWDFRAQMSSGQIAQGSPVRAARNLASQTMRDVPTSARDSAESASVPGTARSSNFEQPELCQLETGWPASVRGGRIRAWQPEGVAAGGPWSWSGWSPERTRKGGGLGRTLDSNCTVKDGIHVYYGPTNGHYGSNSGSHNKVLYQRAPV